jgi:predicted acylesterase/phospholipase RssA
MRSHSDLAGQVGTMTTRARIGSVVGSKARVATTAGLGVLALLLSACVSTDVGPINIATPRLSPPQPQYVPDSTDDGSVVIAVSISGGGTRAAAFGYGVLRGIDAFASGRAAGSRTRIDDIRIISGTSGGAVTAAYLAYKGHGYKDLRERFLLADAEQDMHTDKYSPLNWMRVYEGGANDRSTFANWLDRNVFEGSRYIAYHRQGAPLVWINASDVYAGTPFIFAEQTFAALCSDLDAVRIADAVAASAAFPVAFTPVVVSTASTRPRCGYSPPDWLTKAIADPGASFRLKSFARAMLAYQNDSGMKYVKLLDGGITDNIGVSAFSLERAAAPTPHGPLSAREAVRLKTFVYIVADAGVRTEGRWDETLAGPKFPQMIDAVTNAGIRSAVRNELDALRMAVATWRDQVTAWRCGLSAEQVRRLRGSLAGWNCRDVEMTVEVLTFADLPPAQHGRLERVSTRFKLTPDEVDLTIEAGTQALNANVRLTNALGRRRR